MAFNASRTWSIGTPSSTAALGAFSLGAFGGKLAQRQALAVSQQQAGRNHRNERNQPQHDAAADCQFFRGNVEHVVHRADGRQLRPSSNARQLDHRSDNALAHHQEDLGGTHGVHGRAVSARDFFIRKSDDPPHQDRHRRKLEKGNRAVNGVQASGELADLVRDAMAEIFGEVREALFHPLRNSVPAVRHQHRRREQATNEGDQSVSRPIDSMLEIGRRGGGKGVQLGRQKDGAHQKHRKAADVEDALDRPDRNLRSHTQVLLASDQIGANQFSGAAEKSEAGKANHGGRNQPHDRRFFTNRAEKNLPSHRAQEIGEVNEQNAVKYVPPVQVELNQPRPVEVSPRAELKVNKRRQYKDNGGIESPLLDFHSLK